MKNKLISLILAMMMLVTPAFADEADTALVEEAPAQEDAITEDAAANEEVSAEKTLSVFQQKNIIRSYAHMLADNYYYGVSDENLLYNVICATIENDGIFDIDLALAAMIESLEDEYAEYYSPQVYSKQAEYYEAEFFGIGAVLTASGGGTVVESVYSGSAAELAGIQAGDQIVGVDGVDTSKMSPAQTRELVVGEEGSVVNITVLREGRYIYVQAIRQRVTESHSTMTVLENNIGYIDIDSFTSSLPEDFQGYIAVLNSQGITDVIIDLRDNGGGDIYAAIDVAEMLIPAGVMGTFKYKDETLNTDIISANLNPPEYNILVLVNENTASASEFLAMALQSSGGATLLGEHTFGKGCMQVLMSTPTGSGLKFTIGEFYSPAGDRIHRYGIEPDITVENIEIPIDAAEFEALNLTELDSEATMLGIEQRLNAMRLLDDSEVDGVYNYRTEAGVRVFQQYSGLEVTGVVDFYTAMFINDYEYTMNKIVDVQMEEALKYFTSAAADEEAA